jgi:hypothetical protein
MRASAADGEGEPGREKDGEDWRLWRQPTTARMEPTTTPVIVAARRGREGSVLILCEEKKECEHPRAVRSHRFLRAA